jgi:hypothetical protein
LKLEQILKILTGRGFRGGEVCIWVVVGILSRQN